MTAAAIARRGRTLQKLSILREAGAAGADVLGVLDLVQAPTRGSALNANLTAAFTGSMEQDAIQVYLLETAGERHLYAQPFDGKFALPGEHHGIVDGTLRGPAELCESFAGPKWEAGGNDEIAILLNGSRQLAQVTDEVTWDWRVGLGRFTLSWLVQLRPLGGAKSHVCMQATGEMRSSAHDVGLAQFTRLRSALLPSLWPLEEPAERPFLQPTTFGRIFHEVLAGATLCAYDPPSTGPVDLSEAIVAALGPHAGGKLSVGSIPLHKESHARNFVMPASLRAMPILALVDLTVLGSARDAVVFTATHCLMRDGDECLAFAWPEIRWVEEPRSPEQPELVIHLARLGEIALPCAGRASVMAGLFRQFAALP